MVGKASLQAQAARKAFVPGFRTRVCARLQTRVRNPGTKALRAACACNKPPNSFFIHDSRAQRRKQPKTSWEDSYDVISRGAGRVRTCSGHLRSKVILTTLCCRLFLLNVSASVPHCTEFGPMGRIAKPQPLYKRFRSRLELAGIRCSFMFRTPVGC